MPTSLMGWIQLLQERTCGTGLAKPHKSQVRPEQHWDPTALCHRTPQRASLLSRGQSKQRRLHNQSHRKSFITKENYSKSCLLCALQRYLADNIWLHWAHACFLACFKLSPTCGQAFSEGFINLYSYQILAFFFHMKSQSSKKDIWES